MRGWMVFAALGMATGLWAEGPKVNGKMYMQYTYDLSDGTATTSGMNAFGVTRFYFGVKGKEKFSEERDAYWGYNLTLDAKDINEKGYYETFVKYAFLELGGFAPGLKVRFGQVPTPWIGFEEHIFGFRFVDPVAVDKFKYMSSTDRGLGVLYTHPTGLVDLTLNVVNGEGYHKPEVSKHKDVMGRISLFPFAGNEDNLFLKGLGLHVYGQMGTPDSGLVRNRYIVALSEKTPFFHLMGDFVMTQDGPDSNAVNGQIISVHGSLDLGKLMGEEGEPFKSFGLFFRYDMVDPNTDSNATNDGVNYLTAGLFVHPCLFVQSTKNVTLALNVSQVSYEDSNKKSDTVFRLNAEVKF